MRLLEAAAGAIDPRAKLYLQKWRWYERNQLPLRRLRIHLHMLRREAFIRFPVHGNVLEALDDGRLSIGSQTLLEPAGEPGLFEGLVDERAPYRLRIAWPGAVQETEDPYSFGLLLGDLDLEPGQLLSQLQDLLAQLGG